MEKTYLFWYKSKEKFNFGDELGPYVIKKLTDTSIKRVMIFSGKSSFLKELMLLFLGIIKGYYRVIYLFEYLRGKIHSNYIVSIGSILHNNFSKSTKIWGAGIIDRKLSVNRAEFYAVRGYETIKKLEELRYDLPVQVGDPALLLPIVYKPILERKNKIGVIPHIYHFKEMVEIIGENEDFLIIDLSEKNIEKTIDRIKSCKYVFSSSLHGLIVSHAYEVPALHIEFGEKLSGDGVKFLDYFSSVKIHPYTPIRFPQTKLLNFEEIFNLFQQYQTEAMPMYQEVEKIQLGLLRVAPFNLLERYRELSK